MMTSTTLLPANLGCRGGQALTDDREAEYDEEDGDDDEVGRCCVEGAGREGRADRSRSLDERSHGCQHRAEPLAIVG